MTFIIRFGDEVDPTPPPKKKKSTKKKAPASEAPASEAPAKKDFGAQAKEILTNAKKTYKSDAGNDVAFTTAISADPKSSEYRSAFGDLTKQIEALQKREAVVEAKKKQEEDPLVIDQAVKTRFAVRHGRDIIPFRQQIQ